MSVAQMITGQQAAKQFNTTPKAIQVAVSVGKLSPMGKVGKRLIFNPKEVERWRKSVSGSYKARGAQNGAGLAPYHQIRKEHEAFGLRIKSLEDRIQVLENRANPTYITTNQDHTSGSTVKV